MVFLLYTRVIAVSLPISSKMNSRQGAAMRNGIVDGFLLYTRVIAVSLPISSKILLVLVSQD